MRFAWICVFLLAASDRLSGQDKKPELFRSAKLVYSDDFSGSQLDTNHWQVRQGTTWVVKDGVLVGSPSPKEFQEKKIVEGDRAHAGFKPVIWLEQVPENLVVHFRVRFDGADYQSKFPLIDVGHHFNTVSFSAEATTLTLKSNQKVIRIDEPYLALNEWNDVTIELKKGEMLLKVNDKKKIFKDPLIDMIDQQQIDFKGIDHGGIMIDDVQVYEGIE